MFKLYMVYMANSNRIQKNYFHLMIQNFIDLIQEALDISENVAWVLGKKFQDGKFSAACFDFAAKKKNPQKRKSIKKCRIGFNRNNIASRYCITSDHV